jgi:hypothetical protein
VKSDIESTPINVNVNAAGGGGGGASSGYASGQGISMPGMESFPSLWKGYANIGGSTSGYASIPGIFMPGMESFPSSWEGYANIKFTGSGMSPKMPLGDALEKLASKFGGIDEMIKGLEAEISFDTATAEMKKLTDQLAKYERVRQNWMSIISSPYASIESKMAGFDPREVAKLNSLEADLKDQIEILKEQQMLSLLQQYAGSYQMGTHYVPKTGLALVHQGEKIIPKNVRYGDSNTNTNNFYISGNDPKKIADEIGKILKYGRSSGLREGIRSV